MKKHIVMVAALVALTAAGTAEARTEGGVEAVRTEAQQAPEAQEVKSMLRLVADWERANHLIDEGEHGDLAWTQAALYVGMLDWAEVAEREDGDDSYYQWIRNLGADGVCAQVSLVQHSRPRLLHLGDSRALVLVRCAVHGSSGVCEDVCPDRKAGVPRVHGPRVQGYL